MTLGSISLQRLIGVHPDLVRVVRRAAEESGPFEWVVTEGLRDPVRQAALVKEGKSRTMRSRHLTGHAVDLAVVVGGVISWSWPLYEMLAGIMKRAAVLEVVGIEWGGDWQSFRDGPHFQLPWDIYPLLTPPDENAPRIV